ncbi:double-strand break repair protein AddB [uncultured Roseobacter sp.]|uniref:double-strand break repair protein AddB n=1 Tax=uncultured Roseobacter sp. TaxID=114847 RepID=UPI00261B82ED|nr:double-strand break repair protein AddB [uncultured Roseobacter sp.]
MFEASDTPRVFGLAPGADFPAGLVDGLCARLTGRPPEEMARVTVIVNTARMQRRIVSLFHRKQALLLPRILLLSDLNRLQPGVHLPPATSALRRRLELISLVSGLLDRQPDLAARASLYALTDSLAALMDEMQGEGVSPESLARLDVTDQSGHWQRTQQFISIAQRYLAETGSASDKEGRQRALIQAIAEHWTLHPPADPVILAGSTGSRGTTMLLMRAIADLPKGAIVLPGFDFGMPAQVWARMDDALLSEDHPQYRFHRLMQDMSISRSDVTPWFSAAPPSEARNALISLSLRPAPVTHAWLSEGPKLTDIAGACENVTLLRAPTPRLEALTIAMRLCKAAEDGQTAALITPDRMLTRQVTAALDRWDIVPDDSAGAPLHLSPPGRFLRHTARLFHRRLDTEALITLLRHPLTHSATDRNQHILNTQRLELRIRDRGMAFPDTSGLLRLMRHSFENEKEQQALDNWLRWVGDTFCGHHEDTSELPLKTRAQKHFALSETVSRGPAGQNSGELWLKKAGQQALKVMQELLENAGYGGGMTASDYADLVGALLSEGEVRDRDTPHPGIMIWGTLEARVHGADLVILAGLNDGTWPEAPKPDPWLNRKLRNDAGLLLPERRIGLSAHDYQQAIGAPEVWLTRSVRSDDAETVASRWLNRLGNLLEGLRTNGGPEALRAMTGRGDVWLQYAQKSEEVRPGTPAPRPSPRPPAKARPRKLSVTEIKRLIRDPYAVYARHVLRLRPLGPLVPSPDALLRGIVLHDVMEKFIRDSLTDPSLISPGHLSATAAQVLPASVPWPAARSLWQARIDRISGRFVSGEIARRSTATPVAMEKQAHAVLRWADIDFDLIARADRIDETENGDVLLYDYKSGSPPSAKEQAKFDKQLLIEAAMIEQGAFDTLGPRAVSRAVFLGLGSDLRETVAPLDKEPPVVVLQNLRELITAYLDPSQGFSSRRMMQKDDFAGDYDLLARFGEWDVTDDVVPEDLT